MGADVKILHPLNVRILSDIKKEWRIQGHFLTGNLERLSENVTTTDGGDVILEAFAPDYSGVLEDGVNAERIPYDSSKITGAKTSKYIQGLKTYAMLRFHVDEKEGLRIAFAIAKKHEKEGMPSKGSLAHSASGERKSAIISTFVKNEESYMKQLDDAVALTLDKELFANATEFF